MSTRAQARIWELPPCPRCGQTVCARGRLLTAIAQHSRSPEQERQFVHLQSAMLAQQWFTPEEIHRFVVLAELMAGDKPAMAADDDHAWLAEVTP